MRSTPGDAFRCTHVPWRDLLRTAKDPRTLLLEDLPQALDVDFNSASGPPAFARRLRSSIRDLTRAFPNLLDAVEEQVREAFGMTEQGREAARGTTAPGAAPAETCR